MSSKDFNQTIRWNLITQRINELLIVLEQIQKLYSFEKSKNKHPPAKPEPLLTVFSSLKRHPDVRHLFTHLTNRKFLHCPWLKLFPGTFEAIWISRPNFQSSASSSYEIMETLCGLLTNSCRFDRDTWLLTGKVQSEVWMENISTFHIQHFLWSVLGL